MASKPQTDTEAVPTLVAGTGENAKEVLAEPAVDERGYTADFISGQRVRGTPEEVEAVQVFARRLVEDFDYPKTHITTRPQFCVRPRPSEEGRERGYPVDIAVFSSPQKVEDQASIIVECKKPTRKDGEKQLKIYLSMSSATIGVWFNGKDHLYLHKKLLADGSVEWVSLPTLPKFGQSLADIGSLQRKQLTVPSNLKAIFAWREELPFLASGGGADEDFERLADGVAGGLRDGVVLRLADDVFHALRVERDRVALAEHIPATAVRLRSSRSLTPLG